MELPNQVQPSWSEEMEINFESNNDRRLSVADAVNAAATQRRKSRSPKDRTNDSLTSTIDTSQKAVMEVPLLLSSDGLSMKRNTAMSIRSKFPISGKWQGGLDTSTVTKGRTGYSSSGGVLSYHVGPKCRLGVGVTAEQGSHRVRWAGTWGTRNNQCTATLHRQFPSGTVPLKRELWKMSVSTTCQVNSRLSANAMCELEPPDSEGPRYRMNVGVVSKTIHQWNLRYGWSSTMTHPAFSLSLNPRLASPHRRLNLFVLWRGPSWSSNNWNVGGSLMQSASKNSPTTLSLGVSHGNPLTNGVVWLFTWIQGDFTLKVPIELPLLHQAESNARSYIMYPLQAVYFSILSKIIQDIAAEVFIGSRNNETQNNDAVEKERHISSKEKSKQEAGMQQEFMGRQAKLRIENERKFPSGLVIEQALYYIEGRNDSMWDVTIPLQFWVTDSRLELPCGSKRNMLGFYDLSDKDDNVEAEIVPDESRKESVNAITSFLSGLWAYEPSTHGDVTSSTSSHKLWVQYQHGSKFYEVEVFDDEELVLPDAHAMQVSAERVRLTRD